MSITEMEKNKKLNNVYNHPKIIEVILKGGVVVMPSDTIYGICGKASDVFVVEKIYKIRKRNLKKPFIILIGSVDELKKFKIHVSEEQKIILEKYWGNMNSRPTSIVLDCPDEKFEYLHRGINTLAFRLPHIKELRDLLLQTGPLVAPSANTEKFPASENIEDAKNYFGDAVDLYVDGGEITNKASTIIRLFKNGEEKILRK